MSTSVKDKVPGLGWRVTRFGDIVRNVREIERDPLTVGLERYVGLEHIEPQNLHIREWGLVAGGTSFTRRFVKGQVLFGKRRAYQRKVAVAEFDGVCSSDILVFEPKDNRLLPELLPFIVQSEGFFANALRTSSGSLSPRTRWRDLAAYEFPLPPLDEQRRIAEILWAADEATERWQMALSELNRLKDVASFTLFGGSREAKRVTCATLCEYITVGIVIKPAELYVPSGVPALRSLNIFPDKVVLEDLVYISEEAHEAHMKSRLQAGDVVVVRSGRPGDSAVIPSELDNINCIDLIIARPDKPLRSEYLSRYLNSAAGRKQLDMATAGTAQKHVNVGALKKVEIPLLALKEQDHIVEKLSSIDAEILRVTRHIEKAKSLKASLLHHLLSG